MSNELLLDYDALTGKREWISTDADGNSFIRYEQDLTHILDANKERQNEGFDKRSDMWHAAHVPDWVQMEWFTKYGIAMWNPDHKDGVRRLLNSNEWRHLRVKHFII